MAGETLTDSLVECLPELIPEGALLVVNDTRVRRARIFGTKRGSGGRVELLFIRRAEHSTDGERWEAISRSSKPLRIGAIIDWDEFTIKVLDRRTDASLVVLVRTRAEDFEQLLE